MNRKLLIKWLEELRTAKRLSQEELGNHLGLSSFPVLDWKASHKVPDVVAVFKMADLFGVTLDYLLGDTEGADNAKKAIHYYEELPDGSLVPSVPPLIIVLWTRSLPKIPIWRSGSAQKSSPRKRRKGLPACSSR